MSWLKIKEGKMNRRYEVVNGTAVTYKKFYVDEGYPLPGDDPIK